MMACDPSDREPVYKSAPCLIAEVVSPSTEMIDRREKLLAYRALESLRYYLLLSQNRRLVEIYRRETDGGWCFEVVDGDASLVLDCAGIPIRCTLADLHEDLELG